MAKEPPVADQTVADQKEKPENQIQAAEPLKDSRTPAVAGNKPALCRFVIVLFEREQAPAVINGLCGTIDRLECVDLCAFPNAASPRNCPRVPLFATFAEANFHQSQHESNGRHPIVAFWPPRN